MFLGKDHHIPRYLFMVLGKDHCVPSLLMIIGMVICVPC